MACVLLQVEVLEELVNSHNQQVPNHAMSHHAMSHQKARQQMQRHRLRPGLEARAQTKPGLEAGPQINQPVKEREGIEMWTRKLAAEKENMPKKAQYKVGFG